MTNYVLATLYCFKTILFKEKMSSIKLNAQQLRRRLPTKKERAAISRQPIYIILEDVLDTYNVGAIFRLAEAVAAQKVILCGQTTTPPDIKIHRAAIGTQNWVPWEYAPRADEAIKKLRQEAGKVSVYAIEQGPRSSPYHRVEYRFPAAFVVGNETGGVSSSVLKLADQIIEIPMWGVNKSLNVMVSLAIVLWQAMEGK
jgi:23S rRNA (guanosine2251-2'-O)-methyltransferase